MTFKKLVTVIFLPTLLGLVFFSGLAIASSQDNVPTQVTENTTTNISQQHGTSNNENLHGTKTHEKTDTGHGHENLGEILPLWSCIPFACMLLSIALFPLIAPNFWHHHFGKISAFWAASL